MDQSDVDASTCAVYKRAPRNLGGGDMRDEEGTNFWDRNVLRNQAFGEEGNRDWAARLTMAVWGFVALGVAVRIVRYLLCFPLFCDEAYLAVNFIDRDYLALLKPLEYAQVCPVLFLWIELTCVKLFGYSEWSLRLFPILCAVGSVFLFRHL